MRKIEKKVESIVYQYESTDGKVFDTKEACEKWESSFEATIEASMKLIPSVEASSIALGLPYANDDDQVVVVKPKNLDEVTTLNAYNKWKTAGSNTIITANDIGKVIAMNYGYGGDWCDVFVLDDWANKIQKYVDEIISDYEKAQ